VQVWSTRIPKLPGRHRASAVGNVPVQLRIFLDMKYDATDRFMRDTIRGCYGAERFLLLYHTIYNSRPVFSRNTIVRVFWPWSPFANNRRRTGVMCFIVSEHLLHLEI